MPEQHAWTASEIAELQSRRERGDTWHQLTAWAQRNIDSGLTGNAVRMAFRSRRLSTERGEPEVVAPPSPDLPLDELLAARKRKFQLREAHEQARALVPVKIRDPLPIGILHFGDPHLDDDGTDIGLLERHAKLVRETPGMYAATPGDMRNGWVGRLAHLWAQQGTTESDSWRLAEWFIGAVGSKWLYIVGGNHDLWHAGSDPLRWISSQVAALYQDSEVRVALRFPAGLEVRVNCRHDFDGSSQWNPAHGPAKAIQLGARDHVAIAGHRHISGYNVLKDPGSGITMHAIRVASYKTFDRYARDKGFRDQRLSPSAVTVVDPGLPETHPGLVTVWWEPEQAAEYLGWLRAQRAAA